MKLYNTYFDTMYLLDAFFKKVVFKDLSIRNMIHTCLRINKNNKLYMVLEYIDYSSVAFESQRILTIKKNNKNIQYNFNY